MGVYRRGKTWWVRFQFAGETIRRSARTTSRTEALAYERHLREERGRMARGGRPRRLLRETMERWIDEHWPTLRPSAEARYRTSSRALFNHFGEVYLDEINKGLIADFISYRLREGAKAATVRRDLACLSSMFSCAIAWDWTETNPVKAIDKRKLREPAARVRFLHRDEYDRLLSVAAPHLVPLIEFAVATGMRFEEQFGLTWRQVSEARREARLVVTKSHTPRMVPLPPPAMRALRAYPQMLHVPWVFHHDGGQRFTTLKRSFGSALRRAEIEDFRWHDLRHTFASWAVQGAHDWQDRPMDLYRLQVWLGHATAAMTQRYAHLRSDELHAEVGTKVATGETD